VADVRVGIFGVRVEASAPAVLAAHASADAVSITVNDINQVVEHTSRRLRTAAARRLAVFVHVDKSTAGRHQL